MTSLTVPSSMQQAGFDAVFNAAVDRYEEGKVGEALGLFQLLLFVDPRDRGVWQALARCHDELGQEPVGAVLRSLCEQLPEGEGMP